MAPGGTTITANHAASGLSGSTTLTVVLPAPTLTSFSPTFGRVGDQITLTGTNFVDVQSVTFNNVPVPLPVPGFTVVSPTTIRAPVPGGATTGPIAVTTTAGTATSSGHFVVTPTQDFQLSALPGTVSVPSAGQAAFNVSMTGAGGRRWP